MEISIKTYEFKKVEKSDTKFTLPDEITYWFETGIRRAIKVIPVWTTWNMEFYKKPEEIYQYKFICVHNSFETKIYVEGIVLSDIESEYNRNERNYKNELIKSFLNGNFQKRTKEQFDADLNEALRKINEI